MPAIYICKRRIIEFTQPDSICPKCAQRKWSMNQEYKDCQKYCMVPVKIVQEEIPIKKKVERKIIPPKEEPKVKQYRKKKSSDE